MGRLVAIARAPIKRAPLIESDQAAISLAAGVEGDVRGRRPRRQITVLFREQWEATCRELGVELPWLARRANLLVEGLATPAAGWRLQIGDVVLEVLSETKPCRKIEVAHPGLRKALSPDWRGGVCCRVRAAGMIRVGDSVDLAP